VAVFKNIGVCTNWILQRLIIEMKIIENKNKFSHIMFCYIKVIVDNIGLLHEYWIILSRAAYHITRPCEYNMLWREPFLLFIIMYVNVMVIIACQAGGSHFNSKWCGNISVYQMILIMANHIHMLTMFYMSLKAITSLLDLLIWMSKMSLVLYVDVEESPLFS
jgi:hypothetical protein